LSWQAVTVTAMHNATAATVTVVSPAFCPIARPVFMRPSIEDLQPTDGSSGDRMQIDRP
jgi:hypothetical protein